MHGADEWWLLLSVIRDHKTQACCSAVCKEWRALCRTLPKLHIKVGVNFLGKKKAERFIRSSLRDRSGIQDLVIEYVICGGSNNYKRTPADESNLLYILKHLAGSLKSLSLQTPHGTTYTRIWSRLTRNFPQLRRLFICSAEIPGTQLGILEEHRKLREIDLWCSRVSPSVVEGLVKFCPLLEIIRVSFPDGPVRIESGSLLEISLMYYYHDVPTHEVDIKACNLGRLTIARTGPLTVGTVSKLERMMLHSVESMAPFQTLDKLQKLSFSGMDRPEDVSFLLQLLSSAKSLKHLIIRGKFGAPPPELLLEQLVPSHVEVLSLETTLVRGLQAHEAFQKSSMEEVLELRNLAADGLPLFNLKRVAVDLRDLEDDTDVEQLAVSLMSILVQLLRCSPQLEFLGVSHPGEVLGPHLSRLEDPRYHLLWGHHFCWFEATSNCAEALCSCLSLGR